jgi:hypothetical protein
MVGEQILEMEKVLEMIEIPEEYQSMSNLLTPKLIITLTK